MTNPTLQMVLQQGYIRHIRTLG